MRFQGANPDNITSLIHDFECNVHELKTNHRTNSENILNITKKLRDPSLFIPETEHKMYVHNTVEEESARIVKVIYNLSQNGVAPHNICILFRQFSHAQVEQ